MPAPCTVTLADPVVAQLPPNSTLTAATASIEKPCDMLPTRTPADTDTRLLRARPWPTWHRTDESDSHVVRSQAVPPTDIDNVYPASPRFEPCTVTLADPVAAAFERLKTLSDARSAEKAVVKLPTRNPAVTPTRRLPICPCPPWHRTDVSDSHVVRSQLVPPTVIDNV